jgi:hypothetical protein
MNAMHDPTDIFHSQFLLMNRQFLLDSFCRFFFFFFFRKQFSKFNNNAGCCWEPRQGFGARRALRGGCGRCNRIAGQVSAGRRGRTRRCRGQAVTPPRCGRSSTRASSRSRARPTPLCGSTRPAAMPSTWPTLRRGSGRSTLRSSCGCNPRIE